MGGYLQRLVYTAVPAPEGGPPPCVAPVLRSDSPVYAADQLLGLAEHPYAMPEDGASRTRATTAPVAAPGSPANHPSVLATGVIPREAARAEPHTDRRAHPARPLRRDAGADASSDSTTPAIQTPAAQGTTDPAEDGARTTLHRPAVRAGAATPAAPASGTGAPTPPGDGGAIATGLVVPESGDAASPPQPAGVRVLAPAQHRATIMEPAPPAEPRGVAVAGEAPPARPGTRTHAAARAPGEPGPSAITPAPDTRPTGNEVTPRPRAEPVATPRARGAGTPGTGAPRIAIGRVTVEIVPDPQQAARAPVQPPTAESASHIGPLGNLRVARRLYALGRY